MNPGWPMFSRWPSTSSKQHGSGIMGLWATDLWTLHGHGPHCLEIVQEVTEEQSHNRIVSPTFNPLSNVTQDLFRSMPTCQRKRRKSGDLVSFKASQKILQISILDFLSPYDMLKLYRILCFCLFVLISSMHFCGTSGHLLCDLWFDIDFACHSIFPTPPL